MREKFDTCALSLTALATGPKKNSRGKTAGEYASRLQQMIKILLEVLVSVKKLSFHFWMKYSFNCRLAWSNSTKTRLLFLCRVFTSNIVSDTCPETASSGQQDPFEDLPIYATWLHDNDWTRRVGQRKPHIVSCYPCVVH